MSANKYPRYQSYKDSGAEWLGVVPASWNVERLKTVAALATSKAESADFPVALENIESCTGKFIPTESEFQADGIAFRLGDVLFGKLRPYLAKAWLADRAGEAVGDIFTLRPGKKMLGQYLRNVLVTPEIINMLDGSTFGSKMPRVGWDFMSTLRLPVPSIDEQHAIAKFLDRETAKVDNLIAKQERMIELLTEKRQAVVTQAVTKGLDPSVPMKDSGVEWLGQVPCEWTVMPLGVTASFSEGLFTDGDWIESKDLSSDGIRYLTSGNVGEGIYKEQGLGFISEDKFNELGCTEVFTGDILISRLNMPVGRACIIPDLGGRVVTCVDNVIFRPSPSFNRQFIVYMLSSAKHAFNMGNLARGATMPRISRSILSKVRFAFPPKHEQDSIVEFLNRETNNIDILIAKSKHAIELQKEHRASLISAAVTGKIDVRGLA